MINSVLCNYLDNIKNKQIYVQYSNIAHIPIICINKSLNINI